jgi:hypothetical protein
MSKARAIRIESCLTCCNVATCYEFSKSANSISEPYVIPSSCPLPAWPSVDSEFVNKWADKFMDHEWPTDWLDRIFRQTKDDVIDMLKSIGVEVSDD